MPMPLRSLVVALGLVLVPSLYERLHAAEGSSHSPQRTDVAGATYYGDPKRRALDGSYRAPLRRSTVSKNAVRYDRAPPRPRPAERPRQRDFDLAPAPIWAGAAPIWAGAYAGIHGGGGWSSVTPGAGNLDPSGALIGAHIGYLMSFGPMAAGIEIDADMTNIADRTALAANSFLSSDVDWLASARFKIGLPIGPAFVYATVGGALASLQLVSSSPGFASSASDVQFGVVAGGGIAFAMSERLSLNVEALHYRFDDTVIATPQGPMGAGAEITTIRAGFTYRFD
ncbi:MAG: porin family protein [Hyphomicrobiaceae bacterium]|nr:porin family protein [Hyphomicrobiaceae bacterium]